MSLDENTPSHKSKLSTWAAVCLSKCDEGQIKSIKNPPLRINSNRRTLIFFSLFSCWFWWSGLLLFTRFTLLFLDCSARSHIYKPLDSYLVVISVFTFVTHKSKPVACAQIAANTVSIGFHKLRNIYMIYMCNHMYH